MFFCSRSCVCHYGDLHKREILHQRNSPHTIDRNYHLAEQSNLLYRLTLETQAIYITKAFFGLPF